MCRSATTNVQSLLESMNESRNSFLNAGKSHARSRLILAGNQLIMDRIGEEELTIMSSCWDAPRCRKLNAKQGKMEKPKCAHAWERFATEKESNISKEPTQMLVQACPGEWDVFTLSGAS